MVMMKLQPHQGDLPPWGGGQSQPYREAMVNQQAESHLKLVLAFYLQHQARHSKMANAADVTLHAIGEVCELHEFEATYKKPEDLPSVNVKDGPRTIEAIDEHPWSVLGERIISLAYVIRTPDNQDLARQHRTFFGSQGRWKARCN